MTLNRPSRSRQFRMSSSHSASSAISANVFTGDDQGTFKQVVHFAHHPVVRSIHYFFDPEDRPILADLFVRLVPGRADQPHATHAGIQSAGHLLFQRHLAADPVSPGDLSGGARESLGTVDKYFPGALALHLLREQVRHEALVTGAAVAGRSPVSMITLSAVPTVTALAPATLNSTASSPALKARPSRFPASVAWSLCRWPSQAGY